MNVLLDTNVLVDYLRGLKESKNVIDRIRSREIDAYISSLTEAELFAGRECEKEPKRDQVRALISLFTKRNVDNEVCQLAGGYKRRYGLPLDDCIIAATASILNITVFTKNAKEFEIIKEITVEEPY